MRSHIARYPQPAHTYCVDATNGATAGSGNAATPIVTIAAVNALALKPGDRVLFKAGETWSSGQHLTPTCKGKPGRLIFFGAYGAGAAPIINSSSAVSNMTVATVPEAYIRISGINSTSGTAHSIGITDSDHVWIDNCDLGASSQAGIYIMGTGATTHDITISQCAVHNHTYNGIYVYNATAPGPTDVTIQDCTLTTNGTRTSPADHGIYLGGAVRAKILRTSIIDSANKGIIIRIQAAGTLIDSCYITTSGRAAAAAGSGIYCEDDTGTVVKNTVFYANQERGLNAATDSPVTLLHNTFVNNLEGGLILQAGMVGAVVKNNFAYQDSALFANTKVPISVGADLAQNTIDYNLWYFDANTPCKSGADYKTFADWQALTGTPDAHGLSADPVLVAEYTDLHIQTTSPCKAAGDATAGVLLDKDGVLRGVAVDIGAYEF